jgi:transcriptional regulator with XRE-family HTH domain
VTLAERFGQNLKRCRLSVGISQETAAIRASLHRTEISALERSLKEPRLKTILKVCAAVEAAPSELLEGMESLPWLRGQGPVRPTRAGRYALIMEKRSKKPADLNRLAAAIVDHATTEEEPATESQQTQAGRIGGQKGGRVRAERMTPKERSEAARRAAKARWSR